MKKINGWRIAVITTLLTAFFPRAIELVVAIRARKIQRNVNPMDNPHWKN